MRNHVKINTFWLGMALQFAKDAGAHRYYTSESLTPYKKNMMKRLWWCCILRDRIISLGVRRPLQIMSADFGSHQPPLSIEDLESEVGRSKVYDAPTKLSLIQLTVALCELAAILTEVIMLAYPLHGSVDSTLSTEKKVIQSLDRLVPSRSALVGWFKKASMSFPTTAGIGDMHESVLLYANLMYIYYQ
jgi:hypothetical protein